MLSENHIVTNAQTNDEVHFSFSIVHQLSLHFRIAHCFVLTGFNFFQFPNALINGAVFAAHGFYFDACVFKILSAELSFVRQADAESNTDFFVAHLLNEEKAFFQAGHFQIVTSFGSSSSLHNFNVLFSVEGSSFFFRITSAVLFFNVAVTMFAECAIHKITSK